MLSPPISPAAASGESDVLPSDTPPNEPDPGESQTPAEQKSDAKSGSSCYRGEGLKTAVITGNQTLGVTVRQQSPLPVSWGIVTAISSPDLQRRHLAASSASRWINAWFDRSGIPASAEPAQDCRAGRHLIWNSSLLPRDATGCQAGRMRKSLLSRHLRHRKRCDIVRGVTKRVPSGELSIFLRKNKTQQSTQNAESHPSRRFLFFPVFSRVSNRSSPPRRLSVRRTRFRGPSATPQFSTDTPKIAAPTL